MSEITTGHSTAADRVLGTLMAGNSNTVRAYAADMRAMANWLGVQSLGSAIALVLGRGEGYANELGLRWRAAMIDQGLASSTISRRLSALRQVAKTARRLGLIAWEIDIPGVTVETYRDTRGPGLKAMERMLKAARDQRGPIAARDVAMIRLFFDLALRRAEVANLTLADVDGDRLHVKGKGHLDKTPFTMPTATRAAVESWVAVRGAEPGPLFPHIDRHGHMLAGISGPGLWKTVQRIADKANVGKVHPHGLRHSAITHALDRTSGDVRSVRLFARHKKIETTLKYDDNRADLAGNVAQMVAEGLV